MANFNTDRNYSNASKHELFGGDEERSGLMDKSGSISTGLLETNTGIRCVLRDETELAGKRMSFDEAVRIFGDREINIGGKAVRGLAAALDAAVNEHGDWGYIENLVRIGKVKSAKDYAALFGVVTVSQEGLKQVLEGMEKGEKWLPIFDAGLLIFPEMFRALVPDGKKDLYRERLYAVKNLDSLRKIVSENLPDLEKLGATGPSANVDAFKDAYEHMDHLKPTGPRLVFTPDIRNAGRTKRIVTDDIREIREGKIKIIDPCADLIRFWTQCDAFLREKIERDKSKRPIYREEFLYMPDNQILTRYSEYVFPNGMIPTVYFEEQSGLIYLDCCGPKHRDVFIGTRIMVD